MNKSKQCQCADNKRAHQNRTAQLTLGKQERWRRPQAGTPTTVMMLHGSPDPSFLLQHLPFLSNYQISILSVTTGRHHKTSSPLANLMQAFTVRHQGTMILTFNENDPNRWLVPNTYNCIKPLNKVKGGAPCLR